MRSFRQTGSLNLFLILAVGALGACSSSSGKPNAAGGSTGDGGGTGGASGGSTGDASTDAPKDTPASTDTQVTDGSPVDYPFADGATSPANMTLSSTALQPGGVFMDANTCAGVNISPPFTWTAGPAGTMSYAITLTDTFQNAAHWVIWDIPSTVTSLTAALPGDATLTNPAGAKQLHKIEFFQAGSDYRGPCPRGNSHTYVFEVTAVPTATLALGPNPHTEDIRAVLQNVGIGHGDLTGTSSASPPPADAAGQ